MKEILNILHTVEFYSPHVGGAELVVQQISERLAARGHHLTVATTKLRERRSSMINGVKIESFDVKGSLAHGFAGEDVRRYQQFLIHSKYDIIMNYAAQQWATDLTFSVLNKIFHKPKVIAPCGYSALSDSKTIRWIKFADYYNKIIPKVIPVYDAAVYHSGLYQDYKYAQEHGFKNSVVIPNAVSEEEFKTAPDIRFRQKYSIDKRYIILCVANFFPGKGQDRVIECFKSMSRSDAVLVLIGREGETLAQLKEQAKGLNAVFLSGIPREDVVAAYFAADLFLFGSYIEASPLVIIEAKASRTPFVSVDCGNVKEWKGGVVCKPIEMDFHANRILDSQSDHERLAQDGYEEWKSKLTWSSVVDQYEDLYERVINERSKNSNIQ